jgi:hypothetical protein
MEEVNRLVDAYLDLYPDEAWGFAHIVLDDYNLSDDHIQWCLQRNEPKLPQTVMFLQFLLSIPESERWG